MSAKRIKVEVHKFLKPSIYKQDKNGTRYEISWSEIYLYTLSMSKNINEICDKKYVPSELATLVFVCNKQKFRKNISSVIKKFQECR